MRLERLPADCYFDRVMISQVAGTSALAGASLDMQALGMRRVCFVLVCGEATPGQTALLHAEQSSDDGGADDWTDLEDSAVDTLVGNGSDEKLYLLDLQPTKRYVRPMVSRATANLEVDAVIAIAYEPHQLSVTQSADVGALKILPQISYEGAA